MEIDKVSIKRQNFSITLKKMKKHDIKIYIIYYCIKM